MNGKPCEEEMISIIPGKIDEIKINSKGKASAPKENR